MQINKTLWLKFSQLEMNPNDSNTYLSFRKTGKRNDSEKEKHLNKKL